MPVEKNKHSLAGTSRGGYATLVVAQQTVVPFEGLMAEEGPIFLRLLLKWGIGVEAEAYCYLRFHRDGFAIFDAGFEAPLLDRLNCFFIQAHT